MAPRSVYRSPPSNKWSGLPPNTRCTTTFVHFTTSSFADQTPWYREFRLCASSTPAPTSSAEPNAGRCPSSAPNLPCTNRVYSQARKAQEHLLGTYAAKTWAPSRAGQSEFTITAVVTLYWKSRTTKRTPNNSTAWLLQPTPTNACPSAHSGSPSRLS